MKTYIIYVENDTTYEINNIECTIGDLLDHILKINRCWQEVYIKDTEEYYDENNLNMLLNNIGLVEMGLGSKWDTIIIQNKKISKDEQKIIKEYSKELLEIYKVYMHMMDEDVQYDTFIYNYKGYFPTSDDFVDYCLEKDELYNDYIPWYIDKERDYLYEVYMNDYWERYEHYFWIH